MPLTSFYTALTGLNNNSYAMNVIGDNLANMNTTAFKSGTANFSELLAGLSRTSETGNPIVSGLGSALNGVLRANTQGTVIATGKPTDVAINGNGFIVVDTGTGNGYTRSGSFQLDKDGNLVSMDGFNILGYMGSNGVINASAGLSPINISMGSLIPAHATSNFTLTANLDCQTALNGTFVASTGVYDSLGASHTVNIEFTKTAAGWDWAATIPAIDTGGLITDPPVDIGTGSLEFDSDGKISSPNANPTLNIAGLVNGAADMDVTFNLLDSLGNSNITGQASASSVAKTAQDGGGSSILKSISINSSGVITGTTEGGQSIPLAQLALANFPNIDGLQKYKGSTLISFSSSGEPSIGVAGSGGRGTVLGSSLEQSNVDMAQEFVKLIQAQRAYQANSRIISTTDELYQDSLNMKR